MTNKDTTANSADPLAMQIGYRFLINEKSYEISFINSEGDAVRLREVNGTRTFVDTVRNFKKRIRNGVARLQRGISQMTLACLTEASLDDDERRRYEMRRAYVLCMQDMDWPITNCSRRAAIAELHEKRSTEQITGGQVPEKIPTLSTVFEWIRKVRNNNGLLLSLAIKDHRRAKRQGRVSDEIFLMLKQSFEQIYKLEQRFTVSDIESVMTARIQLENESRDPDSPPLMTPCRRTISDYMLKLDPLGAYEARFGKHKSRMSSNYGGRLSAPNYVCGLVYADCHLMDILVRDDALDITYRPWLIVLLCARTRAIIGWEISALPPSAEKLTRAIKMAISETAESPFRGLPSELLVDNGPEFRNGTHLVIASLLGFQITYAAPRTPNAKAPVERFFRTLNFLIHRLAGTVNSNPLDRGDYDSEGNAIYTLEQLREVFSDILNIYHHRSMSNVGQSPKTVWETLLPKHQPRVFDPDFVRTLGGKAVKCTVNKGRVEIKGIAWHSPSLPELEMRLRKDGAKALVHYDPCDLTYAWVRHPNEPESVIRCDPCDPVYQTGMTMKLHGEIRREARRIEAETGNEARMHMLKAAFIIKALEDANSSKGRSRQTKRARAEYHDHIQKAAAVMNDVVLNITPHEPNPMALPTAGQNMDTQAPDIGLSWADVPDIAHRPTDLPTAPSSGLDWADVPSC